MLADTIVIRRKWPAGVRLRRLLDILDARSEHQASRPCADAVECVHEIDRYHSWAGAAERKCDVNDDGLPTKVVADYVRILRGLLRGHESVRLSVANRRG